MNTSLINPYKCPDTDLGIEAVTSGHPGIVNRFKMGLITNKIVISFAVITLLSAALLLCVEHHLLWIEPSYGGLGSMREWLFAHLIFVIFGPLTFIVIVVKFVTRDVPNPLVATVLLLMASVIFIREGHVFYLLGHDFRFLNLLWQMGH